MNDFLRDVLSRPELDVWISTMHRHGARDLDTSNSFLVPLIIVQTIIVVMTTSFVFMKCYTRRVHLRTWTTEDYLMVVSWALFMAFIAGNTYQAHHGGGKHTWELDPADVQLVTRWIDFNNIIYSATMAFSRAAVYVTYMNIFTVKPGTSVTSKSSYRRSANWWFMIALICANAVFYLCSMLLKIFVCIPQRKIWDPSVPGHCMNLGSLMVSSSVWNTFADLVVLILPILFIRRMKLTTRAKWQIIGIFTLGAIAYPIFSIVGIVVRALYVFSPDQTFWLPRILVFLEAEIGAGLICACVPSLTYLLKRIFAQPFVYANGGRGRRGKPALRRYNDVYWDLEAHGVTSNIRAASRQSSDAVTFTHPGAGATAVATDPETSSSSEQLHHFAEGDNPAKIHPPTSRSPVDPGIWKTTEISVSYDPKSRPQSTHADPNAKRRSRG